MRADVARGLFALSVFVVTLFVLAFQPSGAAAQGKPGEPSLVRELKGYSYDSLEKKPWKAFLYDLALPGAGNVYNGIYVNAAVTIGLSVGGAALWMGGALSHHDELAWAGIGTFAVGRAYGFVSAPWGAALLNAAFRRQLGVAGQY